MGREILIPRETEAERQRTIRTAVEFPWRDYQNSGIGGEKVIDLKLGSLFDDLQSGRFWGPLSQINGYFNPFDEHNEISEQRLEKHKWAKKTFSQRQLQNIVQLCVDSALTRRKEESNWPGTKRPHSLLYNNLIANPDSMFGNMVTPEFVRRLNNGRFWEEIPNMSPGSRTFSEQIVQDVLLNHYEELDAFFAPYGLDLFESNRNGRHDGFGIDRLKKPAIRRYGEFVEMLDSKKDELKITEEQLAPVVRPFVTSVFGEKYDKYDEGQAKYDRQEVKSRLNKPFVQKYLDDSPLVNRAVRDSIARDLVYPSNRAFQERALVVLHQMPNAQEALIGIFMKERFGQEQLDKINTDAQSFGFDIKHLTAPISKLIQPVA